MPAPRPRSLILTFYGAFVRRLDGWIAVSHLVALMADLDLDEQSVRSAVSRLKRRGWLLPGRRDGQAGYTLADLGRSALDRADERIYSGPSPADPAQGWGLVVFSVPEAERHRRHVLRSRLAWLGFGNNAPGVWIAPRRLLQPAREHLRELGLTDYVDLYEASYTGFGDLRDLVDRSWDLAGLRAMYASFVTDHRLVAKRWDDPARADGRAAYVDYLTTLDRWRALPFLDPGLPAELLPDGWEGHAAAELFHRIGDRLAEPAFVHVRGITGRTR
ncbi:MAG TPA: PaaX family transcriptional regulator C-terminal domain-containing protein [Mycobacteriales bacterium]|nr:PaaX family transcriptional regulator C-terminal domain-containing protein [Mycobacteriales bacterium]